MKFLQNAYNINKIMLNVKKNYYEFRLFLLKQVQAHDVETTLYGRCNDVETLNNIVLTAGGERLFRKILWKIGQKNDK